MTEEIKGLAELNKKLSALKGIKDNPDALLAGAYVIEKHVKEDGNIPVVSGFLKGSGESRKTDKGAEFAETAEYSWYVEMGTSKMAAQPHVRPAIDNNETEIVQAVADELKKDIGNIAGG